MRIKETTQLTFQPRLRLNAHAQRRAVHAGGRIAHNLRLPSQVPRPVPYDFKQPLMERLWFKADRRAAVRYFQHLCATEAGEWIFKKVENVEGLYFARPLSGEVGDARTDPYKSELPWIERKFMLIGDSLKYQGLWLIQPPLYNYRFVEHG